MAAVCCQSRLDWRSKKVGHSIQSFSPNRFTPVTVEVLPYRKESGRARPSLGAHVSLRLFMSFFMCL